MSGLFSITRNIILLGAIAVTIYFVVTPSHDHNKEKGAIPTDDRHYDKAPDFSLTTMNGEEVSLESYRGGWLLLNFWATWCKPCLYEMPSLQRLKEKMAGKSFTILAVHSGSETLGNIARYFTAEGLDFSVAIDGREDVSRAYGVTSLPTTFLINHKGEVVGRAEGMREWDGAEMSDYFSGAVNSTGSD